MIQQAQNFTTQLGDQQIKGVLFDLDGTLADTAPDLVYALNLSLADAGFATVEEQAVKYAATHGSLALVKAAQPKLDEELQVKLQQGLLSHYSRINGENTRLFPYISELLDLLERNHIPFGVVTNKHAQFTRPLLNKMQLTPRLASIISGNSSIKAKPYAEPMRLAAQQMGIACEHILYLGDAARDLEAAQNANMLGAVAHWGYLSAQDSPFDWPADYHFSTSKSLYQVFDKLLS